MTLTIDFRRHSASHLLPNGSEVDLRTASVVQLRYSLFMGDIILRADGVDLSSHFGGLAMLSALRGVPEAYATAVSAGSARFLFPERDDALVLQVAAGMVRISCSYSSSVIHVSSVVMATALLGFIDNCLSLLVSEYPSLLANSAFLDLMFGSACRP
jgi:hypothetical protein